MVKPQAGPSVDGGLAPVEVEPEADGVNGNGHRDAIDTGPAVKLALVSGHKVNDNGRAPAPVNGNVHHDETPGPQQSLFSWADFMAEDVVKPKTSRQVSADNL